MPVQGGAAVLCAAAAGMLVPPAGDSHLPPSSPGASSDALAESTFLFWVLAPCKWAIAPVLMALLYIVPRLLVTWELMSSEELFLALPLPVATRPSCTLNPSTPSLWHWCHLPFHLLPGKSGMWLGFVAALPWHPPGTSTSWTS